MDKYPRRISNGLSAIGRGYISIEDVLGFIDLSCFGNSGKDAIIFTENCIAFDHGFDPISISYQDMKTISLSMHQLHFGSDTRYHSQKNGKYWRGVDITISDTYCNLQELKDCLDEILAVI